MPVPVTKSAIEDIRQRGEVRIGVLYNYPPFSYRADNGDIHGYEIDLAGKIAEKWGVKATFIQVTRQTRIPFLNEGMVDMLAGAMPHRRELEQFVEFSDTTFVSGYVPLVSNDSGIDSAAAIGTNAVGAIGNDSQAALAQYASTVGISPAIQVYPTLDDARSAFSSGTIRVLVGRREDMMRASNVLQNVKVLTDFVSVEPYAFAVRRGDTPLRDLIDLTLQDLAKAGTLSQLFGANLYGYTDSFSIIHGDVALDFAAFPANIATGESVVARLRRGEAIRVGGLSLAQQTEPFDSQPIIDGYNRAVINEMARRWNVPVSEIPQSAGDAGVAMLKAGQVDVVVGFRPDVAFIGQLGMSEPYYQRALRMLHLGSITINGIDDLNFKAVLAVDPIDISQDLIKKNSEFAKIQTAAGNDEAFKSLAAGSVYAIVGDEFAMSLMAKADTRMTIYNRRFRPTDYVMALPVGDADFIALVNFTLQDMKADGTLDQLRTQYFGPYTPADDPLQPMPMEIWPGDGSYIGVGEH